MIEKINSGAELRTPFRLGALSPPHAIACFRAQFLASFASTYYCQVAQISNLARFLIIYFNLFYFKNDKNIMLNFMCLSKHRALDNRSVCFIQKALAWIVWKFCGFPKF